MSMTWPPTNPPASPAPHTHPPRDGRSADPGSRSAAGLAWICLIVLLVVVAALQQGAGSAAKGHAGGAVAAVDDPEDDPNFMIAKIAVRLHAAMPPPGTGGAAPDPLDPFVQMMETAAHTNASKLRLASVVAELKGVPAATERLDKLEADLPADATLRADVAAFRALLTGPTGAKPDTEALRALTKRHGFFASLAAMQELPDTDPARAKLKAQGNVLVAVFVLLGCVVALAVLTGFGLFITALVLAATRRLRFAHAMPAPGGSLGVEMAAVFFGAFLLLKAGTLTVSHFAGKENAVWFSFIAQWVLIGVIAWPRLRGMNWANARQSLGLHSGRGVFREVGSGVVGYLACLPILLTGAVITLIAMLIREAVRKAMNLPESGPAGNPIFDLVSGIGGLQLVILVALAVLWAPLVEETVFRGGLFRQIGSRTNWMFAAGASALVFALGHAYDLVLLFPVFALGFSFALIRQWRASLIASMTAHFIHNSFVMTVALSLISLLRD